jgi:CheY-like chemotaxis protein
MGAILIVEDDDDIRGLLADVFRREGYDVLEAEHGAHALDILAEQAVPPCLMILDLMMPVMSGPELLKALSDTDRLASLPVVVVSAGGRPEDVPEARRFVRKPPSPELLRALAEEFCGRPTAAVAKDEAPLGPPPLYPLGRQVVGRRDGERAAASNVVSSRATVSPASVGASRSTSTQHHHLVTPDRERDALLVHHAGFW